VEPELDAEGAETGFDFVTTGEGRRLAQLLRAKRKQIKKTEPIRCVIDSQNDPAEISLDENVTREDLHPADQYERFRELAENRGWGTLRRRELDAVGSKLAAETGLPHLKAAAGEHVAGTYRQSLTLSSGRFAMIDNGLGFQLVPWSREIDRKLGQHIAGVARAGGGIEWSLGRKRDLGL